MKIERGSLVECFETIVGGDFSPHNPVLVYNHESGGFSIQSDLVDLNCNEHIISGQLDTSDGMDVFLGDLEKQDVANFVDGMQDYYIQDYIIGDIGEIS